MKTSSISQPSPRQKANTTFLESCGAGIGIVGELYLCTRIPSLVRQCTSDIQTVVAGFFFHI